LEVINSLDDGYLGRLSSVIREIKSRSSDFAEVVLVHDQRASNSDFAEVVLALQTSRPFENRLKMN
jgi:hypothetical protein